MTLGKITIDNNVRYVSKDNNSQNEYLPKDTKPTTASIPKKQKQKVFTKCFKNSLKLQQQKDSNSLNEY